MDVETKGLGTNDSVDLDVCIDRVVDGSWPGAEAVPEHQARAYLAAFQWLWNATPPEVAYYIARKGTQVRVILRNYQGHHGILQDVQWRPEALEVKLTETHNDFGEGILYKENKTVRYPLSIVAYQEFISDRETVPEPNPVVQSLEMTEAN